MKTIFLFLSFYTCFLKADIVFIDLNNVEMEINVAKEAAKKKGEKLIVLPLNRSNYLNPELSKLKSKLGAIEVQLDKACEQVNQTKCQQLYAESEKIRTAIHALPKKEQYTADKMAAELASINTKVTSVMISGHDGGGEFYGEFGNMSAKDFLITFNNFSGRDEVQSLYLLGCNSATTQTFGDLWKRSFPKALFIAGYEGIGYLKDNSLGHEFIRRVMTNEQNIIASKNMSEAEQKFKLISVGDKIHAVAGCLTLDKKFQDPIYLSSLNKPDRLAKVLNCEDFDEKIKKIIEFHKCALSENNPCALSSGKGLIDLNVGNRCSFTMSEKLDDITKLRNETYILSILADSRYGRSSIYGMFEKLPANIKKELDINPNEITTFKQVKDKLLLARDSYQNKVEYESIKDLSFNEFKELAANKYFYENMWLAVSDLDTSKLFSNPTPPSGFFGTLRAQAFLKSVKDNKNKISVEERLEKLNADSLNKDLTSLELYNIKVEIEYLKNKKS